MMACNKPKLVA